jgi:phosphatidylserine/phosphatidylglycerophosphate/cardiolipin synthase-like enzyme
MTNDKFKDALISAYNRGLEVKIMVDDDHKDDEDIVALKNAGIEVFDDNRSALMHNKFLIVDKRVVWSGSTNYTYYAFYRNNENAIRIENSSIALFYKQQFDELVAHSTNQLIYDSDVVDIYFSPEDDFKTKLISLIDSATFNIYFMIYAFTDKDVADALIRAKNRGVFVRGVFDEGFNANQYSKYDYLKNAGVDVKLDGGSFTLHDKVMIFDGITVVTGSYNFTISANQNNAENSLIIDNSLIYQKYENEFVRIYNEGKD